MSARVYLDGVWYKSRLEAQWAAFFTEVGMEFQYEPKTVPLPTGWYVPDFWLKREYVWVEVKGDFEHFHQKRYQELAEAGNPVVALLGLPSPNKYAATLFAPKRRFAECYPVLTNAALAGFEWDKRTLWLVEDDSYMKLRRQWERQVKRQTAPTENCPWIAAAMRRGEQRFAQHVRTNQTVPVDALF